jgi:hypothetical protein
VHSGVASRELVKELLARLPPLAALTLVTKQVCGVCGCECLLLRACAGVA